MADKYPPAGAPYYGGHPSAPPPQQMPGMPQPHYYPPPSYDAAMGGHSQMPMYPSPQQQPGAPPQGYGAPMGFQPMPQYYPPAMPQHHGGALPPYPQGPSQGFPHHQPHQPPPPGPPGPHAGQQPGYFGQVAPVTAVFDSGARFKNGPVTVPPPPPGYMPTAAQVAAMNGQSVHVQKEKAGFFTGGKGAGFTFW